MKAAARILFCVFALVSTSMQAQTTGTGGQSSGGSKSGVSFNSKVNSLDGIDWEMIAKAGSAVASTASDSYYSYEWDSVSGYSDFLDFMGTYWTGLEISMRRNTDGTGTGGTGDTGVIGTDYSGSTYSGSSTGAVLNLFDWSSFNYGAVTLTGGNYFNSGAVLTVGSGTGTGGTASTDTTNVTIGSAGSGSLQLSQNLIATQLSGAANQQQAAQAFFDAYREHDLAAAQKVALPAALSKLTWDASAAEDASLVLADSTHIKFDGGSIELKMSNAFSTLWIISDVVVSSTTTTAP